jgi:DNA-binding LacI/PurR family transcriptional regulator
MVKVATMEDVAAATGVSVQTVSRVINNKTDVSERTRQRVLQAIQQLGYRPNTLARSLVSHRSLTLGLICGPLHGSGLGEVVAVADHEVRQAGYVLMLTATQGMAEEVPPLLDLLRQRQVDGLLLLAPGPWPDRPLEVGLPVVAFDYPVRASATSTLVDLDGEGGTMQAARHLLSKGHHRVGIVAGPRGWKSTQARLAGAQRVLGEAPGGLDSSWVEHAADWGMEAGDAATRILLGRHAEVTALLCHSDWLALGALRALREQGRRVPEEVSLVGYGDSPVCLGTTPKLTSVGAPGMVLGELVGRLLVETVQRGSAAHREVLVPTALVVRESVAKAR